LIIKGLRLFLIFGHHFWLKREDAAFGPVVLPHPLKDRSPFSVTVRFTLSFAKAIISKHGFGFTKRFIQMRSVNVKRAAVEAF